MTYDKLKWEISPLKHLNSANDFLLPGAYFVAFGCI